jgi:radical SAM protein with 4Fe4S-binding SPASM domain
MVNENPFLNWKFNIENLVQEHPLQIISWEATRRCNLSCKHCGSPAEEVELNEELATEEVISAFSQIEQDFDMSQFRHINITGGEPFVRKDLIEILENVSQSPHYRNIDIQTNGLILGQKPELLGKIKELGVTGIGVSIDGLQDSHDSFRGIKGSYDLAMKAARKAVEEGLAVTVSTVAHAKNLDQIPQLYELVKKEIKPRTFRIMTIDPIGRADLNKEDLLSNHQTKKVINFLQEQYADNCERYADKTETMVELGCGGWLGREVEGTLRPFIFHCVAGINNLGILYDGKLAACSNIPRDFGFEGDLRKDNIKNIWDKKYQKYRDFKWKKTGDCKSCGEWDYCHGGPMHKMKGDGSRSNCLYQIIKGEK